MLPEIVLKEFVDLGTVRRFATYKAATRQIAALLLFRVLGNIADEGNPDRANELYAKLGDQLNPVAAFPSIVIIFLIASIAGWYVGNLIQCLRR
jgi:predicted membrane protein